MASMVLMLLVLVSSVLAEASTDEHPLEDLDMALLRDLLPAASARCTAGAAGAAAGAFNSTLAWSPPHAASDWSVLAAAFEEDAFLAKLAHVDNDPAKSWELRVVQATLT